MYCLILKSLGQATHIEALIPKPKSIEQKILDLIQSKYTVKHATREEVQTGNLIAEIIDSAKDDVVLIDIGGYF